MSGGKNADKGDGDDDHWLQWLLTDYRNKYILHSIARSSHCNVVWCCYFSNALDWGLQDFTSTSLNQYKKEKNECSDLI